MISTVKLRFNCRLLNTYANVTLLTASIFCPWKAVRANFFMKYGVKDVLPFLYHTFFHCLNECVNCFSTGYWCFFKGSVLLWCQDGNRCFVQFCFRQIVMVSSRFWFKFVFIFYFPAANMQLPPVVGRVPALCYFSLRIRLKNGKWFYSSIWEEHLPLKPPPHIHTYISWTLHWCRICNCYSVQLFQKPWSEFCRFVPAQTVE